MVNFCAVRLLPFQEAVWVRTAFLLIVAFGFLMPASPCLASLDSSPLVIVTSVGSAPFEFVDKNNKPTGMFVDLWRLWAKKIGVDIEFRPVPWAETLTLMKDGRADIHAGLFFTRQRDAFLDYGPELYASGTHIFFSHDIKKFDKPNDLKDYRVGVIKGDLAVDFFKRNYPDVTLTLFADNEALFNAVRNGTIKVFVKDTPIALYHLKRRHLLADFRYRKQLPLYSNMFYAGVRQGDKELMALVKKGMAMISPAEREAIESRWVTDTNDSAKHSEKSAVIKLTDAERVWLKGHKTLRLGVDPAWPPFEFFDSARVYSGIASDYVKDIAGRLGESMRPVADLTWSEVMKKVAKGEIDVLPCVVQSPERSRYLLFTKPYLNLPMVIVTRADFPLVSAVTDFGANRLAVVQGYVSYDFLHNDFPNLKMKLLPDIDAALQAVSRGDIDGFVGNIAAVSYAAASLGLTNIKVAQVTPYHFALSMAVRKDWPQLVPILDKALAVMEKEKRDQIYKYWTNIRIEKDIDWQSVLWIGSGIGLFAFLVIAIFAYWNRRLSLEVRRRIEVEGELLKLTEAVEQSSASVVITDREGTIEYVNPQFSEITGYTSGEAIGQNPRILKSGCQDQKFYADLWQTILTGKIWRGDFCNKKKNGEEYWESASIAPITDDQGNITNFVAVQEDITQRIKMEDELRRAKVVAEDATRAKSDFLAHMSHEIRTPMNAVMGMTHLCLQTPLSAKQTDYLQKIDLSARSLLQIINDVLDFSKIEAGKLSMEKVNFFLDEVLDNIASMTGMAAHEKGLELIFDRHADVPDGLVGDPLRLGQILLNLVSNAIKFTEKGQVTVEIGVAASSDESVTLQCVVRDTGIGLSKTAQAGIFKSFSQADDSVTRRYGGTGLGLTICKKIVELMAGRIWVESISGQGSAFFFTATLGRHQQPRQQRYLPNELAGLRVLAVDDNETFLRILSEMLVAFGFQVTTAVSGEEVETILIGTEAVSFDLILLDWNLPGANGIEITRRLRQKMVPDTLPVIILMTAYGSPDLPEDLGHELPLLLKPFTGSTLFDKIVNVFCGADESCSKPGLAAGERQDTISGCRILAAEDNSLNLQVVRELLQSWGVLVDTAVDGLEALDMVQKKEYDLVLLDIQMPKMDGLSAARQIRALGGAYQNIPILAMTAHALSGDRAKSLAAGMNDHVIKPLDPDIMRQTLVRWLGKNIPAEAANTANNSECPAGVDCESALRRLAGNIELYHQLLREFCSENKTAVVKIEAALAQGDWDAARRFIHTLKGVSGNLGVMAVHESARQLEEVVLARGDNWHDLLHEINKELEPLLLDIERLIGCEKRDTGASVTLNADEMDKGLQELLRLVEIHDIDAELLFNKLSPTLRQKFQLETDNLGQKITNLDFTAAQRILSELIAYKESE